MTDSTLARLTGSAYAAMIPGGLVGFLYARGALVDPTDPAVTLANVLAQVDLARLSIAATTTVILPKPSPRSASSRCSDARAPLPRRGSWRLGS